MMPTGSGHLSASKALGRISRQNGTGKTDFASARICTALGIWWSGSSTKSSIVVELQHVTTSSQPTTWPSSSLLRLGCGCELMSPRPSPTLAELLMPLPAANPFSTMRASLRWYSSEELEDGVTYGGQSWLRRGSVDSFFSALLLRDGDAAGRRKRSSS